VVVGESMMPTFSPGDRLIVWKRSKVDVGDVIALPDPNRSGRTLVKRVTVVGAGELEVAGDNREASTDSRHFGPVPATSVIGTAVYRYHPPARTGWIGE
jgi:nickel-type superoxide dismutase maturation protease